MNTMDLEGKKMLIRPNIAESANKKNIFIGEPRKDKGSDEVLGRQVVLDKQPDGNEIIKITIKNPTLGGQPQVQENTHVKFVKPKSPEIGKWKTNEAKVQRKRIKPTFDTLLSKYANQAADSSSNRSSNLKRSRSPPREEFQHHASPYGSWASGPWMPPLHYAPYYMRGFNGGWGQLPMAPYAFHPGWAEPRRPVHERLSYPTRGRLNNGVNRPMQDNQKRVNRQVWRAKSPSAEISEPSKQKEKNASGETIMIGTKELIIKEPIIVDNPADSNKDVAVVHQGPMANDH